MPSLSDIGIASSDCVLTFESSITGEYSDSTFRDGVQVMSFVWGATVREGGGRRAYRDIELSAPVSKASPQILQALAQNTRIRRAVLHVRKQGGEQLEYYTITLGDVRVSSYQSSLADVGSSPIPVDRFTLNFSRIDFDYVIQLEGGGRGGGVSFSDELPRGA